MTRFLTYLKRYLPLSRARADRMVDEALNRGILSEREWWREERKNNGDDRWWEDTMSFAEAYQLEESRELRRLLAQLPTLEASSEAIDREKFEQIKTWLRLGVNPLDVNRTQTLEELWAMQDAAFTKTQKDPHARGIANTIEYYTVGRGVTLRSPVPEVDAVIQRFWRQNRLWKRHKDMVRQTYIDGEYFVLYFLNLSTGDVTMRRLRPREILEVETHPEDLETRLTYLRRYYIEYEPLDQRLADMDYYVRLGRSGEEDENLRSQDHEGILQRAAEGDTLVQFIKIGPDDEIRGRVPMEPVLPYLKRVEDLTLDASRRGHELAKVIWIKTLMGRLSETTTRERRAPAGGIMLVETENVKYRTESPSLAAGDMEQIRRMLLYGVGSGVGIPLHILDQNAENENYASIKRADTPFTQLILSMQDFWDDAYRDMLRVPLRAAVLAEKLPPEITYTKFVQEALWEAIDTVIQGVLERASVGDILAEVRPLLEGEEEKVTVPVEEAPIDIQFPLLVQESILETAQAMQIWQALGVSQQTLLTKLGLDWRQELANQKAIREMLRQEQEDNAKRMGLLPQETPGPPTEEVV